MWGEESIFYSIVLLVKIVSWVSMTTYAFLIIAKNLILKCNIGPMITLTSQSCLWSAISRRISDSLIQMTLKLSRLYVWTIKFMGNRLFMSIVRKLTLM